MLVLRRGAEPGPVMLGGLVESTTEEKGHALPVTQLVFLLYVSSCYSHTV